jgi:hypothetical protein
MSLLLVVPCLAAPFVPDVDKQLPAKVLMEKPEIKDIKVLYDRAINRVSDIPHQPKSFMIASNKGDKFIKVEEVATSQLLKSVILPDNTKVESYATTQMVVASEPLPDPIPDDRYDRTWDSTYACMAYSTIYWDRYTNSQNFDYVKLTSATGGWTQSDNVVLSDRCYRLHAKGVTWSGQNGNYFDSWVYPNSNSFSRNAPASWEPVLCNSTGFNIGIETRATLTRGGSVWYLFHNNNTQR